jgi:peptidoglycan/LPS O-acetylase OafA/YrhL
MSSSRNFGLDVARATAIIPVLAVHYCAHNLHDVPAIIYILGEMGVEMFFALSGFLIGGIILRDFQGGFSTKVAINFYVRRWMRTLPLYYVFFIVSAFVTIYGITLDKAWSEKCWAYLLFLQNLAWPMLAPWYHETWSLAIEEWFYLIFPILFTVFSGIQTRTRVLLISLVLIITPLLLRIVMYSPDADFDEHVRKIVIFRLDSIAFGILAIWAVTSYPYFMRRWKNVLGVLGAIAVYLIICIFEQKLVISQFVFRTFFFSFASAAFALLITWAYFTSWDGFKQDAGSIFVVWFSTRSYALYLCHGSILRTMIAHGWVALPAVISFLIFAVSSCVLAELAHRCVERPFMKLRPRELVRRG